MPAKQPDISIQFAFCAEDTPPDRPEKRTERFRGLKGDDFLCTEYGGEIPLYRLSVPQACAEAFCQSGRWLRYLPIGRMFLPFGGYFLHASGILFRGKAYLFTAPSGGGKSTHAELWAQNFGAEILNGDKILIREQNGIFTAYGSPLAGSSGIYNPACAPLGAVFRVRKAPENNVTPLKTREAFMTLYSESLRGSGDAEYDTMLIRLLEQTVKTTPILTLECLPDPSAAECAGKFIEENGL